MTNLLRKHAGIVTMLAVVLGFRSVAFAQTSVIVEVRVLELSRTDLEAIGGTMAMPGFAKPLTNSQADSLASGPKSRVVHRIELPATGDSATQVRLDSRITVTSSNSADVQTFFDAGIVMDVTPKIYQNRDISLATASQVRIRRGPDAAGTSLVVFENPFARFDTRIHDGESVILGGFISSAERVMLPDMPMLPDNPILNYLYPKARNPQDRTEIAILLTPRIVGPIINPAVDAPVIVSKPAVVNPAAPSLTPPAASALAAATSPSVITTQSAITSALPVASPAAAGNNPPVTSPPMAVSTPTSSSIMTAPSRPPAVASPSVVAGTSAAPVANLEQEGTGGRYTVQVGAFDQLGKAESLRSQLAKNYDMVFVEKVGTSKTPYRVRVGRFSDMQSARKIEKQLVNDGIDTYVTTLN
jgi:general secretion pathway protein D